MYFFDRLSLGPQRFAFLKSSLNPSLVREGFERSSNGVLFYRKSPLLDKGGAGGGFEEEWPGYGDRERPYQYTSPIPNPFPPLLLSRQIANIS
jgi:hypothetical protein